MRDVGAHQPPAQALVALQLAFALFVQPQAHLALGHDPARHHAIDADVVAAQFAGQHPGETQHRRLAARIDRITGALDLPAHRTQVDDRTAAPRAHAGQHRLRREKMRPEVDRHPLVEIRRRHVLDRVPVVGHLDEFFHLKYEDRGDGDHHDFHQVATAEELLAQEEANADEHIHLPSPSYWPIVLALGLPIMAYGVIYNILLIVVGGAIVLLAMFGWGMEPHTATDHDYDPPTPEGGAELEVATHG